MMKKTTIAIFSILALIIVVSIVKVKKWFNQIDYGVADGFKISEIGFKKVKVYLPIYISNPTPFKILLSNLNLNVFFDNFYLANINTKGNYALLPKQYSTYPLEFEISTKHLLKYLSQKGYQIDNPDWKKNVEVKLEGSISVDAGIFKVNDQRIFVVDNLKSYVG